MLDGLNRFLKSHPRLFDLALRVVPRRGVVDQVFREFTHKHRETSWESVRFVFAGCADGLRWDPLRPYVVTEGWKGVFVEPVPTTFDLLRRNYAHHTGLTFVNAAIGGQDSDALRFWTLSDAFLASVPVEVSQYYLRKSSFDQRLVAAAATDYTDTECAFLAGVGYKPNGVLSHVVSIPVKSMTLNTLIEQQRCHVDFLMLDTEGHEAEIIPAIDFARLPSKPKAILYETLNMSRMDAGRVAAHLKGNGYAIRDLEGDALATLG